MSRALTHTISLGLVGTGVFAWAFAGRPLVTNTELRVPLNPLGINGSPYGEVFAMAMQGPIDTYVEMGMHGETHQHADGETCDDHDHDHDAHSHADGETCEHHDHDHDAHRDAADHVAGNKPDQALGRRFEGFLASLSGLPAVRTNPRAASTALKFYLRRQAEDKLRFAYQMDPSHYGNYNTLHFFLTEPAVGTRKELTPSAAKLAEDTIQYCLKREDDPRPALTAAAAGTNILMLMFADMQQHDHPPRFTTEQTRQYLNLVDFCLARYVTISKQWDESGNWELLSPQRVQECNDRFHFIGKVREAAEKTIIRLEGKLQPQVSNTSPLITDH